MAAFQNSFLNRVRSIPFHGTGLSVDLHVPDLFDLIHALNKASLSFDYLEIYRGPLSHLKPVQHYFKNSLPLEYHADGLWFTQPEFNQTPWKKECEKIISETGCLNSRWITHECATKQINGYSFGTYLPPLLTEKSADLTGRQSALIQDNLDKTTGELSSPLFLIETPPFYTFAVGDISLDRFFQIISESTPCGFLLDIGHVYTYYLTTENGNEVSPDDFFENFLDKFPLERVVQIHLGGLRPFHNTFLDDHGSLIPEILFRLLEKTLQNRRLINLKGLALEVDTKEIDLIISEYKTFLNLASKWGSLQGIN
ncbi:MAG: multinuclear nonheme iron-dependent oxidase [Nitrospiria bacterium]